MPDSSTNPATAIEELRTSWQAMKLATCGTYLKRRHEFLRDAHNTLPLLFAELDRLRTGEGSLDSLRNFLGDMTIKLPVGRAIQLIKDQQVEIARLRECVEASYATVPAGRRLRQERNQMKVELDRLRENLADTRNTLLHVQKFLQGESAETTESMQERVTGSLIHSPLKEPDADDK